MIKEGIFPIFISLGLAIFFYFINLKILFLLSILAFVFFLFFFRDPKREVKIDNDVILSPADGKIIEIENQEKVNKISIFMSLFDVHINRAPISGTVERIIYSKGKFVPAFLKKAACENESNTIFISSDNCSIILKQIAGVFARRIVCWIKERDKIIQGEKIGLIKFGSRVEVFLPKNVKILVKEGDKVKAGINIIGVIT